MQIIKAFNQTRIVLVSQALMKQYNLQPVEPDKDLQLITFLFSDQCLDMLVETEEEIDPDDLSSETQKLRAQKKLSELELRLLLLYTGDTLRWQ
ncbi:MAG: hypothetical protein NTZ49_05505 [Candidatus Parcubacteria bacterium]|nr:hypothetical protein [Candidatus Parcubacteria bacterium]